MTNSELQFKALSDIAFCEAVITNYFEQNFGKPKKSKEKLIREIMIGQTVSTIQYLHTHAESEIEKVFGSCLCIGITMWGYVLVPGRLYLEALDPHFSYKENEMNVFLDNVRDMMKKFPVVALMPQALVGRKRIDIAVWVLVPKKKKQFSLAVELDGYEFHRKKFKEDRIKDRDIKRHGYEHVFRFSGSEVWNDPIKASKEVADWIVEKDQT